MLQCYNALEWIHCQPESRRWEATKWTMACSLLTTPPPLPHHHHHLHHHPCPSHHRHHHQNPLTVPSYEQNKILRAAQWVPLVPSKYPLQKVNSQSKKTQINHHCTGSRGPTLDLLWKLIRRWMLRVRFAAFLVLSGDQIKPLCIFMSNYYCTTEYAAVPTYFCTSLCVFLYFLCSCYSFSCTRVASLTRYAYSSPTMILPPVMLLYIAQLW